MPKSMTASNRRCSLLLAAVVSPARAAAGSSALPPFLRAARSLALCDRKDESDSSIAKCDEAREHSARTIHARGACTGR
jgi:hypothetical protein